jgi:hypothetical protein
MMTFITDPSGRVFPRVIARPAEARVGLSGGAVFTTGGTGGV